MTSEILTYIVDIDNTICSTPVDHDYRYAQPWHDRIKTLNNIYDQGHRVIYWTARGGSTGIDWTDLTHSQLAAWGCKYDEIRMKKPSYDVWIDDKAFNSEEFFK